MSEVLDGSAKFQRFETDYIVAQVQGGIRLASGLQICWGKTTYTGGIDTPWGSLYMSDAIPAITFPWEFYGRPSTSINLESAGNTVLVGYDGSTTLDTGKIYLLRGTVRGDATYTITYTAIGRWK